MDIVAGLNLGTAEGLLALPKRLYPWFDVCHVLLCVLTVRKEAGRGFAREHPLAAWLSCMVSCFAGSLLANPLLGKPMMAAFADEFLVAVATLFFVLVFFSPGDSFHTLVKLTPVYLPVCAVKEVYRAKKIFGGLADGSRAFPASPYLVPVAVAVLKGNGSAFMAPFARAVRGDWRPADSELMRPSVTTKECLLAALVFARFGTPDVLYLSLVGLFLTVKLGGVLGAAVDPFAPLEAAAFAVVDAVSGAGPAKKEKEN